MSEGVWTERQLGEVADLSWGDTNTTKASYVEVGFPAFSAKGQDGFLDHYDFDRTGVVISAIGANCGQTWLTRGRWSCIKNTIRFWSTSNEADTEYLYWLTRSPEFWPKRGSAQPFISQGDARGMRVRLPPICDQQAIAALLGALDDKIDANRRMNKTLEAMARTIFKDWFVDFGPVRAKADGQPPPGLAAEIAALFPTTLDGNRKPNGWIEEPFDRAAKFLNGLAMQKHPAIGDDALPVIKIAELRSGITGKSDRASVDLPNDYVVNDGDILFSWSGSLTHLIWTGGRGALNQHLFKVTSDRFPRWFLYLWLHEHLADFQAIAASKATTMGHIQRHHLTQAMVTVPNPSVLKAADALIGPLIDRCVANALESRTLAELRDLLLPKLMSGEIRLRDARRAVGAET